VTDVVAAGHDLDDGAAPVVRNLATCREFASASVGVNAADILTSPGVRDKFVSSLGDLPGRGPQLWPRRLHPS
jgi:hypothetical protein